MNHGRRSRANPFISGPVSPRHVTKAEPPGSLLGRVVKSVATRSRVRQVLVLEEAVIFVVRGPASGGRALESLQVMK